MVIREVVAAGIMMMGVRDGRFPPLPGAGLAAATGNKSRRPGVPGTLVMPETGPLSAYKKVLFGFLNLIDYVL